MSHKLLQYATWAMFALLFAACSEANRSESSPPSAPKVISVPALAASLHADECAVFDANTQAVRVRNGAIPGATLLSHYRDYKLGELPPEKQRPLVFYCANQRCTASDAAAERALRAGYADVSVLRAGIAGWANAGNRTQSVD